MSIDYQKLIDEAMLSIVKKILQHTKKNGITQEQSFYISFQTDYPGVMLSSHVKEKYPAEITIVLQHQFKDLNIHSDSFSVNLSFGGIPETIMVPFASLTNFVDPTSNFSLQFKAAEDDIDMDRDIENFEELSEEDVLEDMLKAGLIDEVNYRAQIKKLKQPQQIIKTTGDDKELESSAGEVVSLDQFRKNK